MQRSKPGPGMAVALAAVAAMLLAQGSSAAQSRRHQRLPEALTTKTITVTEE